LVFTENALGGAWQRAVVEWTCLLGLAVASGTQEQDMDR